MIEPTSGQKSGPSLIKARESARALCVAYMSRSEDQEATRATTMGLANIVTSAVLVVGFR